MQPKVIDGSGPRISQEKRSREYRMRDLLWMVPSAALVMYGLAKAPTATNALFNTIGFLLGLSIVVLCGVFLRYRLRMRRERPFEAHLGRIVMCLYVMACGLYMMVGAAVTTARLFGLI